MPKRRKNDTQEFRDGAVDLLRTSDQPLSQVARELGVSVASLRNWKNQFLGASAGMAGRSRRRRRPARSECQGTLGRQPETAA